MRNDLTDITVVLDRSGSMVRCQGSAERGLRDFIDTQRNVPGEVTFRLRPRGATSLLDAIGTAISATGERLRDLPEAQRPGLVVMVILTDGKENSSREFTRNDIKKMIEHQQNVYSWKFIFLGANQDAFTEAGGIGITKYGVLNYVPDNTHGTFGLAANNILRMRSTVQQGGVATCTFNDTERASAMQSD